MSFLHSSLSFLPTSQATPFVTVVVPPLPFPIHWYTYSLGGLVALHATYILKVPNLYSNPDLPSKL